MNVYAVLDAALPSAVAVGGLRSRLHVVAARKRDVSGMLAERGITCVVVSGATIPGPFTANFARLGLMGEPAVYAYPIPHDTGTPLMRIDSRRSSVQVATMGEVLAHLGVAR